MKRAASEPFKRACSVIKNDRTGVSSGMESTVSNEIARTLSDFFSINGNVQTDIVPYEGGFIIKIQACAKSVKRFRIID